MSTNSSGSHQQGIYIGLQRSQAKLLRCVCVCLSWFGWYLYFGVLKRVFGLGCVLSVLVITECNVVFSCSQNAVQEIIPSSARLRARRKLQGRGAEHSQPDHQGLAVQSVGHREGKGYIGVLE